MRRTNAKERNLVCVELFNQVVRYRGRKLQSLKRSFDNNLPATGDAEKQLIRRIFEVRPVLPCQPRVVGYDPQEDVGVEKDFHRPNASRIASGNGASKSSGTTKSPFPLPTTRRRGAAETGVSLTRGRPERMIITSSPAKACSRSRDRCVFAS